MFFLAEHNLPFHGSSTKIGDSDNGLFLGTLELLGKHNRVLALHLQKLKCTKKRTVVVCKLITFHGDLKMSCVDN